MEGGVADALLEIPWLNDHDGVDLTEQGRGTGATRAGRPSGYRSPSTSPTMSARPNWSRFERFEPPVVVKLNSTTRASASRKPTIWTLPRDL